MDTPTENNNKNINLYENLQAVIDKKSELKMSVDVTDNSFEAIKDVMSFTLSLFDVINDTVNAILDEIALKSTEDTNGELNKKMYGKASEIKNGFYKIVTLVKNNNSSSLCCIRDLVEKDYLGKYKKLLDAYKVTILLSKKIEEADRFYNEVKDYHENEVISLLNAIIGNCRKKVNNFPIITDYKKLKEDTENDASKLSDKLEMASAEKTRLDSERQAREERERLERERLEKERLEKEKQEIIENYENNAKGDVNYLNTKLKDAQRVQKNYKLDDGYYKLSVENGNTKSNEVETIDFVETATVLLVDLVRTADIKDLISSDAKKVLVVDNGNSINQAQLKAQISMWRKENLVFTQSALETINKTLKGN